MKECMGQLSFVQRYRSAWVVAMALHIVACKKRAPLANAPDAAWPSMTSAGPALVDASRSMNPVNPSNDQLIELLHNTPSRVMVSSVVANHTDRPENLVDGNLSTAWSSSTGELQGATVAFVVPDDVTISQLKLTVGMPRMARGRDLFLMNPRITRVRVMRGNTLIKSSDLDPSNRELQTIEVTGAGGRWSIIVDEYLNGTRDDWREISISELQVWGRTSRIVPNVPSVTVGLDSAPIVAQTFDAGAREATDAATVDVSPEEEGQMPLSTGCFAWSASLRSALCITGEWGNGRPREWLAGSFGPLGDDGGVAAIGAIVVASDDNGALMDDPLNGSDDQPRTLYASSIAPLWQAIQRHGFVPRSFASEPIASLGEASSAQTYDWQGNTLRFRRRSKSRGGDMAAPTYDDRVHIRWAGTREWVAIAEFLDEPVEGCSFSAIVVDGGEQLILSAERPWADEGQYSTTYYSWVCDRVARRCR